MLYAFGANQNHLWCFVASPVFGGEKCPWSAAMSVDNALTFDPLWFISQSQRILDYLLAAVFALF